MNVGKAQSNSFPFSFRQCPLHLIVNDRFRSIDLSDPKEPSLFFFLKTQYVLEQTQKLEKNKQKEFRPCLFFHVNTDHESIRKVNWRQLFTFNPWLDVYLSVCLCLRVCFFFFFDVIISCAMEYVALTHVWICIAREKRMDALAMFDLLFLVSSLSFPFMENVYDTFRSAERRFGNISSICVLHRIIFFFLLKQ